MDIGGLWVGWGRLGNLNGGCSGGCDNCGELSIRYSRGGVKGSCEETEEDIVWVRLICYCRSQIFEL
jgi:hypothetical protein